MSIRTTNLLLFVAAALLFIPFLGNVHLFDWDEVNFAESAREMIVSGNYSRVMINFQPFWEKPPLFFWMQVASMKIFGVNEFAARFPNAVCGIATVLVLYNTGRKLFSHHFGLWWTFIYMGCFLPHFYFKSGIIDPWFNLFIFLGIYFLVAFLVGYQQKRTVVSQLVLSAVFTGLGILTKGPVALLIVLLTYAVFIAFNRGKGLVKLGYYLLYAVIVFAISMLWFGYEIFTNGITFLKEFYEYQIRLMATEESGHGGPLFYHFVVLLLGVFPASLFIFRFRKSASDTLLQYRIKQAMLAALIVVLVVFSLVQTKIVHYSSFAYFPISFLAAVAVYKSVKRHKKVYAGQLAGVGIIGGIWALLGIALPIVGMNTAKLIPLIEDEFAAANLQADVHWSAIDVVPGLAYAVAIMCSIILLKRKNYPKGFMVLFGATLVYVQLIAVLFVPRIEKYTQHAAIEFLKSLQGKEVYVETYGYKSYAQYYYAMSSPPVAGEVGDAAFLLEEKVSRPVYVICRIYSLDDLMKYHGTKVKELYRKNGFVFFEKIQP